jgi:hypothetical protein
MRRACNARPEVLDNQFLAGAGCRVRTRGAALAAQANSVQRAQSGDETAAYELFTGRLRAVADKGVDHIGGGLVKTVPETRADA